MKTIAEIVNEQRKENLYVAAAKRFGTTYKYAWLIATGKRKATRGKGIEIKNWMKSQLNK